jgi:hypothetical protein
MEFRESRAFSKRVDRDFSAEEYRALQLHLVARPDAGQVIPGTGGLRKLRWSARGQGKRGGARIIYFWFVARARIYLLAIYAKNEQDDLSAEEKRVLRGLVEAD